MQNPKGSNPRPRRLDRTDRRILALLQSDARLSNKEIAERVNLSPTPCLRRVGLLEEDGYIRRYTAMLDRERLGFSVHAFLSLKRRRESSLEELTRSLTQIPEVLACHIVSGEFDLMVELVALDMSDYSRITLDQISQLPGIYDLRSTFSIRAVRTGGPLPVERAPMRGTT